MSVPPEKLHELLRYCIDFAKVMLGDSGEFYPFGAVLRVDGEVKAVGGYDGKEHPKSGDIYRILFESSAENVRDGSIAAAALAANVYIPAEYSPPAPDGLRVHLESQNFARFIYVPYRMAKQGMFKKRIRVEFLDPIPVQVQPSLFSDAANA